MMDTPIQCDYCTQSHSTDAEYISHLAEEHTDELSRIDQRRVQEYTAPSSIRTQFEDNLGIVAMGGIVLASIGMILLVVMSIGGGEPLPAGISSPNSDEVIHAHGFMTLTVDGTEIDLTSSEYQGAAQCFHFHPGQQTTSYHLHCTGVTPSYALYTIGVELGENGEQATFNQETFSTAEGDQIDVRVNGERVDPFTYELSESDRLHTELAEE